MCQVNFEHLGRAMSYSSELHDFASLPHRACQNIAKENYDPLWDKGSGNVRIKYDDYEYDIGIKRVCQSVKESPKMYCLK